MAAKSHEVTAQEWYIKATDELAYALTPDIAHQKREQAIQNLGAYAQLAIVAATRAQGVAITKLIGALMGTTPKDDEGDEE